MWLAESRLGSRKDRPTAFGNLREGSWGLAVILAFCAALIVLRWAKMDSLYNTDPSMWLSQVGRFARGEMPYRDFSWNYPPLAIFLLGWLARRLGATFAVIQAAIDIVSLAIVLLSWWLVRYLLPASTRFVTVMAVVAIGATSTTKFNLFSFSTYSPALEIAAAGLLMLLIGGARQLGRGAASAMDFGLIAGGVFIASVTKPEAMVAAWGGLTILFALDCSRQWRWYGTLFAISAVAGTAVYLAVGLSVGFDRLKAGIGGYGLASFACPWWPTGLGVFGAAASVGEAVFAAAVLLSPFRRQLRPEYRPRLSGLWCAGCGGFLLFVAYVWYQCGDVLISATPGPLKLEALERVVVWTSPVLLPVMWASICVWICLIVCRRGLSVSSRVLCFVLAVPVIMSVRGLFGTTLFPYTEVSAMCYPFFVIAAACLIEALYGRALVPGRTAATVAIAVLLGGYSLVRLINGYPTQFSDKNYYSLRTNAGTVRLSDGHISEQIYSYILNHTTPDETLLDLPYGGGFNFATRLPSPAFTTQFQQLRMPVVYQHLDLKDVRESPPRLVIAERGLHFQTQFGVAGNMSCPFPRLVWEPNESSWIPGYLFPLVAYIEQNYRVVAEIGPKVILGPAPTF